MQVDKPSRQTNYAYLEDPTVSFLYPLVLFFLTIDYLKTYVSYSILYNAFVYLSKT